MPYIRKHAKPEIENFLDVKIKSKVIVFDIETNGLDKEYSVLSCSAIKYELNPETYEMIELDRFNRYYLPIEQSNPPAISVNGLTRDVITEKRGNADYPQYFNQDSGFEKFCNDVHRFVAHNIFFDTQFIPFLKGKKQFCTMMTNMDIVAVEFFESKNEWKWPKLSETAIHYGIPFIESGLHYSMYDTEITAKIFLKMIEAMNGDDNEIKPSKDAITVNNNKDDPDFQRFLEADGLIFNVDGPRIQNTAYIGTSVNLWIPPVKNPDNVFIYLRSPGPPLGIVPSKYSDIVVSHLVASMDYDARIVDTCKIKCRLISREETERRKEEYKASLIKELKKPYNPNKPIMLMIATKRKKAVKVGEKLKIEFEDLDSYSSCPGVWPINFLNQIGDTIANSAQDRTIIQRLLKAHFNSYHLDVEVVDIAITSEKIWDKLSHKEWNGYRIQLAITAVKKSVLNNLSKLGEQSAIPTAINYEATIKDPKKEIPIADNYEHLHEIVERMEDKGERDYWYYSEIKHIGLGTFRVLRDAEEYRRDNKVKAQFRKWDEQYLKIIQRKTSHTDKEASLKIAEERTRDAKEKLKQIDDLLVYAIGIDNTVTWESLKDTKKFNIPNPKYNSEGNLRDIYEIPPPTPPTFKEQPIEPDIRLYKPDISFIENIFESIKAKKIEQAKERYQEHMAAWKKSVYGINTFNSGIKEQFEHELKEYEDKKQVIKKRYDELEEDWKNSRELYYKKQTEYDEKIDKLKNSYLNKNKEAVIQYCEIVLNNSKYPDNFPKDFDIDYNPGTRNLIVEYFLPTPDDLPSLKEVKYIASKKELKESFLSQTQIFKNYDSAIYKITLRTLHELFEADKVEALETVIFNGWVKSINKATGNKVSNCIVTIQAKKSEFSQIELSNVDPKICFKSIKGIGGDKFSNIPAVQPIAKIKKNNKRFTNTCDNSKQLNDVKNNET